MKPDLDSLTAVFEAELSKHGMVMADGYATEAITSSGVIDEWAARQLARELVRQRSPEKPGMDMLVDADTVEMDVREVAKLIWALAEAGRAGSGEDPLLTHVRRMALGEIAVLAAAVHQGTTDGETVDVPRAELRRVSSALTSGAEVVESGALLMEDLEPIREQLVGQLRADGLRAERWASV